jgi:hypothetical protein
VAPEATLGKELSNSSIQVGRLAMPMQQSSKALLVLAVLAALPVQAADVPSKAMSAGQSSAATGGASQESRLVVGDRYRALRHLRAMTIRRCAYLGCPGNHILGIGF